MRILVTLLAVVAIAGCKQNPELPAVLSPYKIDIQQGNVVTQEMVGKLKAGMTRSQVRFVLGSPLVIDMFHADRWDYIYLMQKQGRPDERRRLTVNFDGDKMLTLEGDVELTDKVQEPAPPAAKPPVAATPATPALKPAAAKPVVAPPVPKPEVAKPVEKAPAAVTPVAKPVIAPPAPTVEVVKPVEKAPAAATPVATPAPKPVTATSSAASTPSADTAKPDAAKSDAKTDAAAAKIDAAKADDTKDPPKRGLFGRMLDKIGF